MRRSKAVNVEVKTVIGALCKVLATAGLDRVPTPETLRRAKFRGGADVEENLWQLLSKILHKTGTVSFEATAASETWRLVAAGLWQTGYYADWMYEMDKGGGEGPERSFSSRDLLIALGWLLATGSLEKLLSQRVQQLDKTLLAPAPTQLVSPQLSDDLKLDSSSMRRLQWLIGRLRHQGRTLLSMQEERARLLHTVLSVSLPSSVPSSTDQSSMLVREDCVRMQELCNLLEAYLNWKQVENIFWIWMDSVVDCHLTDLTVKKPTQVPERSSEICHHGNRGLEKLDDMLLRLPTAQKQRSRSRADMEGREHGSEKGHGTLDVLLSSPPSMPSFACAYRARLQDKRPVQSSGAEGPYEVPVTQAMQLLLQTEAQLVERRNQQRRVNRTQLEDMIGSMDDLVLIPP